MQPESAVSFPTPTRIHMALGVADVPRAIGFYRSLFGQEPTKVRDDYAKFEVFDPPVSLSLSLTPDATAPALPQHFGVQVQHRAAIDEIADRLADAGFAGRAEGQVTCCYAISDKVWAADPDGHQWEVYIVTQADTPIHSAGGPARSTTTVDEAPCCAPTCCK
ncbi:MAG: VOC family protein [Deltaproteobacteria bacterium]|nr:VOC family protein [Deltaproteobacteria bacterium]